MEKRVVGYVSNWITEDQIQSKCSGYTDILFAFWESPGVVRGAAEAVVKQPGILQTLKNHGKKCFISAGGEHLYNPLEYDAREYGRQLALFAMKHQFDGMDFDIENIQMNAAAITWLANATNEAVATCKQKKYKIEVSHAPQAPYFTAQGGYAEVEKQTNGAIDFYNIQYYNQGSWSYQAYTDYDMIFNKTYNNQVNSTSIECISEQIPATKLVIGKPITQADVNNTGFIQMDQLADILRKAQDDNVEFGGVMGWKIDSDTNGQWGDCMNQVLQIPAAQHA